MRRIKKLSRKSPPSPFFYTSNEIASQLVAKNSVFTKANCGGSNLNDEISDSPNRAERVSINQTTEIIRIFLYLYSRNEIKRLDTARLGMS